jgi:hypothetical protein
MVLEENQIQSAATTAVAPTMSTTITPAPTMSPTMPTTRLSLPRYNGRRIDNSDLLEAIDHADHKLFETFDLVNSISGQTTRLAPFDCYGSNRLTHVTTHEQLRTCLTITITPERPTTQIKTNSQSRRHSFFPHGLRYSANLASHHARRLFANSGPIDLTPSQRMRPARHLVNMVFVRTLPKIIPLARIPARAPSLPRFYTPRTKTTIWISPHTLRDSLAS